MAEKARRRKSEVVDQAMLRAIDLVEGGMSVANACRKAGVEKTSFYRRRRLGKLPRRSGESNGSAIAVVDDAEVDVLRRELRRKSEIIQQLLKIISSQEAL